MCVASKPGVLHVSFAHQHAKKGNSVEYGPKGDAQPPHSPARLEVRSTGPSTCRFYLALTNLWVTKNEIPTTKPTKTI